MVLLTLREPYKNEREGNFYFKTMEECKSFLYVFKDHWCNIPWDIPKEVSSDKANLTNYQIRSLEVDPKKRAEENLSWGFNFIKYHDLNKTTEEQILFIQRLQNNIN